MKKSVNKLRVELQALANAHDQIHSFFWGDLIRAVNESEVNYPLMQVVYPTASFGRNTTTLELTIGIFDKIYKDWTVNLNEVESDTLKYCRDVFRIMNKSPRWNRLGRVDSCTLTKAIDATADEIAGHIMRISFTFGDFAGTCGIPVTGYDFEGDEPIGCLPVDIYENGVFVTTVDSGGTYSYVVNDVTYSILDTLGTVLYSGSVASGGTLSQTIQNSTAVLKDTLGTIISSTPILAEGTEDITAPNGVVTITDKVSNVLHTVSVKSNGTASQVISDTSVDNTDLSYSVTVNAEGALILPDSQINLNGVDQGDVVSVKTINIDVTDGVNPVTPISSTLADNTLIIEIPIPDPYWNRNPEWLPIPSISTGEQVIYLLFRVNNSADYYENRISFTVQGNYTVDWDDGNTNNYGSGVQCYKQFAWADVGNETSDGYRQAMIKITPEGNLTAFNLYVYQISGSTINNYSNVLDCVLNIPNLSGTSLGSFGQYRQLMRYCERIWIKEIGAITTLLNAFSNMPRLQSLPVFDSSSVQVFGGMVSYSSLRMLGAFDTTSATSFYQLAYGSNLEQCDLTISSASALANIVSDMFYFCPLKSFGNINCPNGTTTSSFIFYYNTKLKTIGNLTLPSNVTWIRLFYSCIALESHGTITGQPNNIYEMYLGCRLLKSTAIDCTLVTTTTNAFANTGSFISIILTGLTRGISVANNQLDTAACDALMTSLGTAAGAQTLTLTGNPGAATCNTAIATGKGFTVVI